jgi:hypothetical protein
MDTSIFGDEKTSKPKFNSRAAKEKTITSPTTSQLKKLRKIDLGAPAQLSQEEAGIDRGNGSRARQIWLRSCAAYRGNRE